MSKCTGATDKAPTRSQVKKVSSLRSQMLVQACLCQGSHALHSERLHPALSSQRLGSNGPEQLEPFKTDSRARSTMKTATNSNLRKADETTAEKASQRKRSPESARGCNVCGRVAMLDAAG